MDDDVAEISVDDEEPTKVKGKKKRTRTKPAGVYVSLPDDARADIERLCEESLRTVPQEIAWIVRDWLRRDREDRTTETAE